MPTKIEVPKTEKIKTHEDSCAISRTNEWTYWQDNREYRYSTGICFTKAGMISLFIQEGDASASIIHSGRRFTLWGKGKITKPNWIRIAKKWARKIRREKPK